MIYHANYIITAFSGFSGRYQGSSKEPDFFFRPDTDDFPSIVFESGWSESLPRLESDKNLWLNGTKSVELVFLLKWTRLSERRVAGHIEVWTRGEPSNLMAQELVSIMLFQSYHS